MVGLPALLVLLFLLLFAASHHAVIGNSDGATAALEGQAIAHGNVALSGWTLSFDSFWTLDAVAYAIADAAVGLHLDLLNAIPALLALGVIAVGAILVTRGNRNSARVIAVAVLIALLALPNHALAQFLLQGPWHVGTTLYCLAAFVFLLRPSAFRYAAGVAFLAAGLLGDLQTALLGVVPVVCCGILVALRHRSVRRGLPLFSAGPVAVALAYSVHRLAAALGTFQIQNQKQTAPISDLGTNLGYFVRYSAALLGVDSNTYGSGGVPLALRLVYLVGFAAIVVSLLLTSIRIVRGVIRRATADATTGSEEAWLIDALLLAATAASVVTFLALTRNYNTSYARYLTAGVIFASLLTARQAARSLPLVRGRWRAVTATLGAVLFGSYAAAFGFTLVQPRPAQPIRVLTNFLEQHHLDNGIGDYWAASIVTVDSGGSVQVRPVNANASGVLVRYGRQSSSDWYRDAQFDFVVYQPTLPYGRVTPTTIARTFGPPSHTYIVGSYAVDVYSSPIEVLSTGAASHTAK